MLSFKVPSRGTNDEKWHQKDIQHPAKKTPLATPPGHFNISDLRNYKSKMAKEERRNNLRVVNSNT
jgi:hypothetical protein